MFKRATLSMPACRLIWPVLVLSFLLSMRAAGEDAARLRIGVQSGYPPYAYTGADGRVTGFSVDVARGIADLNNIDVQFMSMPDADLPPALKEGRIDAIAGITRSDELNNEFAFSDAFTIISHEAFAREGTRRIEEEKELFGKDIIVVQNTPEEAYVKERGYARNLIVVEGKPKALGLIESGRADYALLARYTGLYWLKVLKLHDIRASNLNILPTDYCFAVRKGDDALLAKFNAGIRRLKKSGRMAALRKQWLMSLELRGLPQEVVIRYALIAAGIILGGVVVALLLWSRTLKILVASRTAELQEEIDQRTQVEEKLRQGEQKYRTLLAELPVGVFETDPQGLSLYVNKAWSEMTGMTTQEAEGTGWMNALHPDDRQRLSETWRRTAEAGGRWRMEMRFLRPDKEVVEAVGRGAPLHGPDGAVTGYVATVADVTELKRTERALRESEAMLRATLDALPVGVIIADSSAHIVDVNPAVARVLHGPLPRAGGLGDWAGMYSGRHPDSGRQIQPEEWPLTRAIIKGEVVSGDEIDFLCFDGVERPLLLWAAPTKDAGGNVTGGVVVFQDISEIRRVQKELQKALRTLQQTQTQLVQSEKLAVVGQLAAGIAHEINNPLSYVSNNLDVLRRDFREMVGVCGLYAKAAAEDEPDKRQPMVRQAQQREAEVDMDYLLSNLEQVFNWTIDGAERIRRIVMDMRSFARVGEAKCKEIDLHEALDTTLRILAYRLKNKNIKVEKNYGDLPFVSCMPDRINQVFLNLIVNAIDASPQDGTIAIATQPDALDVRIAISDTGAGIKADRLHRIFDPFYTTKAGGTGLGLSISQSIVNDHGGRIEVDSAEGKGSTFTIVLPAQPRWEEVHLPISPPGR